MDGPAALLNWLDGGGSGGVLGRVHAALDASDAPYSDVLVALDVDLTALAAHSVELAMEVVGSTREVADAAAAAINRQLAAAHLAGQPQGAAEVPADEPPPTVRVWLELTAAPLPVLRVGGVWQQAVRHHQRGLVQLLGVVSGVSPPCEAVHSRRYGCPACGGSAQVARGATCLPCCSVPTIGLQEDLSGRLMVPAQQVWVSELSSADGSEQFGVSAAPLLVRVPEHQVGRCFLGELVLVVGEARLQAPAAGWGAAAGYGAGAVCSIKVAASSIQPVPAQALWALPPAAAARLAAAHGAQPLQLLWDLLGAGLGARHPVDPHLALAMCLSGAAAAAAPGQPGQQVSLLLLHEAFAPGTQRMLRRAAALLSAQSVAMPMRAGAQPAEHVNPIVGGDELGGGGGGDASVASRPVFASLLHLANAGVAVADLPTLPARARQQLLEALRDAAPQGGKPLPQGLPARALPLSATCWALAAWQDVHPDSGALCCGGGKTAARKATTAAADYQVFDLCLGDGTLHEAELYALLDRAGAPAAEHEARRQLERDAAARLRHLVAAAAAGPAPVLTAEAQAFLGDYFLVARQSMAGTGSKVSKPLLLGALVRVAGAAARLHHQGEVLGPDAALAVLLVEQSLANRLGVAYQPLLDLPCDLQPANGRSLDGQVQLLHSLMARAFRQINPSGGGGDGGDGGDGCAGGGADSGCSGLGGSGGALCGGNRPEE